VYAAGDRVVHDGALHEAIRRTQAHEPGAKDNGPWAEVGAPVVTADGTVAAWTATGAYDAGDVVAHGGHRWEAQRPSRGVAPGTHNAWADVGAL
jgi:5'-nucleotidase